MCFLFLLRVIIFLNLYVIVYAVTVVPIPQRPPPSGNPHTVVRVHGLYVHVL